MATRLWFPIARTINKENSQGEKEYAGYFSCMEHVAKFLDIDNKALTGVITTEREYNPNRANTRVDSSKIKQTPGADDKTRKVQVILQRKVGRKRVIIQTRKKIADSKSKDATNATHQISLAFPNWATAITISDALAEIIPANKISTDSSKTDTIPPAFKLVGGGSYGIISREEAQKRTNSTTSEDQVEQKLKTKGGKVIEGQE